MYADKIPRLISYHDTWISVDPVRAARTNAFIVYYGMPIIPE